MTKAGYGSVDEVMEALSAYDGGLVVLDAGQMISALKLPPDLARKLLDSFAPSLTKMMRQMKECEASGQWDGSRSVSSVAHSCKGATGQVGARRLFAACDLLDKATQGGRSAQAIFTLQAWYRVAEELETVCATVPHEVVFDVPITTKQTAGPSQSALPVPSPSGVDARTLAMDLLQDALANGREEQARNLDVILRALPQ